MKTKPSLLAIQPFEDLEAEARALRNLIYGYDSCDDFMSNINWELCKENWMADIHWLRRHSPIQ
jgi:hypothetical protein